MKKIDRIFLGVCFGTPMGLVGMTIGTLFAVVFNKIAEKTGLK